MAGAGGCRTDRIRIEMATDGDSTSRTFASNALGKEDVERLSGIYATAPKRDPRIGGSQFAGTFGQALPSEVGNRNGLSELRTRLGTSRFYFEAIAERADEWSALKRRMDAGELWVRLFGRWAERGIKDPSRREEWQRYVDGTLVPMSTKLMLLWGSSAAAAQSVRVAQQLRDAGDNRPLTDEERLLRRIGIPMLLEIADRGVLRPEETHLLFLIGADANASQAERDWVMEEVGKPVLLRLVQRFRPETKNFDSINFTTMALGFLLWANTSRDRNDLLLASPVISDEDKTRIRAGQALVTLPPPFGIDPTGKPKTTEADVRLKTTERPFLTNGEWNAATNEIVFASSFVAAERRTTIAPAVYYAAWSEPDVAAQIGLFGTVILRGEPLAEYGIWIETLPKALRLRWEQALDALEQEGEAPAHLAALVDFRADCVKNWPMPKPLDRWIDEWRREAQREAGRGPARESGRQTRRITGAAAD